ncbi:hypothetical protein PILCRDRAFT_828953 [Piloderma croceum F 1598]|uniref:Uncharacterized protein n=1 Tax=Piloderma croceum (strain F 1598) TaxID=765440 RepID=A0A0C3AIK7_PILCF|nr:hypothetical protein PILCRDRAFT_828953 [Piloderma croceum F 1598]
MYIYFCICLLLGQSQVTAKLDFGTYKIINQALQLSLYSHEAGQPIYVSTSGNSSELVHMPTYLHLDYCRLNSYISGNWVQEMHMIRTRSKMSA